MVMIADPLKNRNTMGSRMQTRNGPGGIALLRLDFFLDSDANQFLE